MMQILLLICAIFVQASCSELNLFLYTGFSQSLNLVCNDGSPAGYYFRPASTHFRYFLSHSLFLGSKNSVDIALTSWCLAVANMYPIPGAID